MRVSRQLLETVIREELEQTLQEQKLNEMDSKTGFAALVAGLIAANPVAAKELADEHGVDSNNPQIKQLNINFDDLVTSAAERERATTLKPKKGLPTSQDLKIDEPETVTTAKTPEYEGIQITQIIQKIASTPTGRAILSRAEIPLSKTLHGDEPWLQSKFDALARNPAYKSVVDNAVRNIKSQPKGPGTKPSKPSLKKSITPRGTTR